MIRRRLRRCWTACKKTSQNTALNEQPIRIKTILLNLLDHSGYVRKRKLQTQLNISDSTLYLDLKAVRKILNKYNLELAYRSGSGYRVEGRETDKRTCLAREDIYSMMEEAHETQANLKRITDLKELLVEIFLENEYKISEVLLESLILHLLLTLQRIERGYFIEAGTTKRNGGEKETRIAGGYSAPLHKRAGFPAERRNQLSCRKSARQAGL